MFHRLSGQELELMVLMIEDYIKAIDGKFSREKAESLIFSTDNRTTYKKDLNVSNARLNNMIASLRKKKLLDKNTINQRLIPVVDNGTVEVTYILKS